VKKKFSDKTSSGKSIYSSKIEIFRIKWCVILKKNDDQFFGIYLHSQEDIEVSVSLQLMNKIDPSKHISKNFEYKYDSDDGYGFRKFISCQVNNFKKISK